MTLLKVVLQHFKPRPAVVNINGQKGDGVGWVNSGSEKKTKKNIKQKIMVV